jgi:hypothetical protein
LHAQECELNEKLEIFNSAGICQHLEHTKTFEKDIESHHTISILSCHSQIL